MSQVIEGTPGPLRAGNTVASLAPQYSFPSVEDVNSTVEQQTVAETPVQDTVEVEDALDHENTFDVSRAEYSELRDAFLRLLERIAKHNIGAPHKI